MTELEVEKAHVTSLRAEVDVLVGALLWLRNHYDVGRPRDQRVVDRIDAVLTDHEPTLRAEMAFRTRYP